MDRAVLCRLLLVVPNWLAERPKTKLWFVAKPMFRSINCSCAIQVSTATFLRIGRPETQEWKIVVNKVSIRHTKLRIEMIQT